MAVLGRSLLLLSMLLMIGACRSGPEQWGPFRGQVVDAETGIPISGAHVMVTWIREPPSLHFSQWFYDAQETVTGADGRFELPRHTRFVTAFVSEPGVGVFTPGYLMLAPEVTPANGRQYVDPTVVNMRPLKTREEQCKYRWYGPLVDVGSTVPKMMDAIHRYNAALKCWEIVER
jgi:hypothetical protein